MSQVWRCDVCGKINPRSIRHLCTSNPNVDGSPLNSAEYYAFNTITEDLCDQCLNEAEAIIRNWIYNKKNNQNL